MLGKVVFESGGVNMEAILTGEGWQCDVVAMPNVQALPTK
jgi:hypothetical protein